MREIKFRAWTNTEITYSDKNYRNLSDFFEDCRDCKIMQYTGLKDKNGKEIYEGDIVNGIDNDTKFGRSYKNVEIDFYSGEFGIKTWDGHLGIKYLTNIEIIGNIYENPELLPTQPQE